MIKLKNSHVPDFELEVKNYSINNGIEIFEVDFDKLKGENPETKMLLLTLFLADHYNCAQNWWRNQNYLIVLYIKQKDYNYLRKFFESYGIDLKKEYKIEFRIKE